MALLRLHQLNNPTELELIDSTDISTVDSYEDHTVITTHAGASKYVSESAAEVYSMMVGG